MSDKNQSGASSPKEVANEPDGQQQGNQNAGGDNASESDKNANDQQNQKPKGSKPDGITPEIQAYIDAQAAAARRNGEAKGKQEKENEIENAKQEAAKQAALEAGQHKELYDTEVKDHQTTKASLTSVQSDLDRLKAALAGQVPNPLDNYKRIVGANYDEMVEDAKTLAASFGNNAHRDPNAPPTVPNVNDGGKFEQNNNDKNKVTTEDVNRNRSAYNVL